MKPDGIFLFHLALQNSAQKHFTHRGHATYIHNNAVPFICRLPYVCNTSGNSNTCRLYLMICGDKNKSSFYLTRYCKGRVPFCNIYVIQQDAQYFRIKFIHNTWWLDMLWINLIIKHCLSCWITFIKLLLLSNRLPNSSILKAFTQISHKVKSAMLRGAGQVGWAEETSEFTNFLC